MVEQHILVFNKSNEEVELLKKICRQLGSVCTASSLEETISLIEKTDFNVLVVDESFAKYPFLRGFFRDTTSVVITGNEGSKLNKIAKTWPLLYNVSYHVVPLDEKNNESCIVTVESEGRKSILTIAISPKSRPMKVDTRESRK